MTNNAIEVASLSKQFRIYTNRPRSIKESVVARRGRRFEEFWALRNVDLEVESGTSFGFVGHNGSGKSTLLRCITGIYKPTSGTVNVRGRISALLELGSGFHPDLTGRENIYLNASILGLSKKEIDAVFHDIVEFSGIGKFVDSPVKVYSSGMYVRLGFAVAVHVRPEILIIDEVVAVGDEEFQRRCFDHIYRLRSQGVTIVMVSHSLGLIQTMCDKVAWFDHGELQAVGPSVEVVTSYLKVVNAREVEQNEAAPDAEERHIPTPEEGGARRGTGEIRFKDIGLLDAAGKRSMFATADGPLRVHMEYELNEPVEEPVFAVSIRQENGLLVGQTTTFADGVRTGTAKEGGSVDLRLDRLGLLPGDYTVSVYAIDKHQQHVYDEIERAFPLHVRSDSAPGKGGIVDFAAAWEFERLETFKDR